MAIDSNLFAEPLVILLVDDDPTDTANMIKALEDARIHNRLLLLRKGGDLLDFLHKRPPYLEVPTPDLILLDLHLTDTHGRDLLEMLRQDQTFASTNVIVIADPTRGDPNSETFDLDVEVFLTRPVAPDNLLTAIRTASDGWICFVKRLAVNRGRPIGTQTPPQPMPRAISA